VIASSSVPFAGPDSSFAWRSFRGSRHGQEASFVNIARGEIVDENALLGEFEHLPMAQLWSNRRVLITPHVSNGSDGSRHGGVDVFCDNLCAYRDGKPLRNVIDWQRGY
jgi:D-2-hydroxyacid dehydrogenase (NADP+)